MVVTDKSGRVESFQEKPSPEEARSNLASTGIYIFEPPVLDLVPPARPSISAASCSLAGRAGLPFFAQTRFFNWIDIGRLSDYWSVLQRVLRGEIAQMEMPGTEVKPGVGGPEHLDRVGQRADRRAGVYRFGVRIDPGVSIIGPAWIGHGCHLRAGSRAERSILFEYTRPASSRPSARSSCRRSIASIATARRPTWAMIPACCAGEMRAAVDDRALAHAGAGGACRCGAGDADASAKSSRPLPRWMARMAGRVSFSVVIA